MFLCLDMSFSIYSLEGILGFFLAALPPSTRFNLICLTGLGQVSLWMGDHLGLPGVLTTYPDVNYVWDVRIVLIM